MYSQQSCMTLLHLVHFDFWGPSRVSSILGFKYFVSFVDGFCKCFQILLMKDRFELFFILQSFVRKYKINCTFHSYNICECLSSQIKQFMSSRGILLLWASCTYNKKGIPERKNRYIVETEPYLLIEVNVPLRSLGCRIHILLSD